MNKGLSITKPVKTSSLQPKQQKFKVVMRDANKKIIMQSDRSTQEI
jgi:hypothetical protein